MPAKWTFLVYMAADNNLDPQPSIDAMTAAALTPDVNVVVEVVKTPGVMTRFEVHPGSTTPKGPPQKGVDTGVPGPLADFITWGTTNYPADRTAVIVWAHGNGCIDWGDEYTGFPPPKPVPTQRFLFPIGVPCGIGFTDTFKHFLPTIQLAQEFKQPVDLIGFDACFMGTIEVATQLMPKASVVVGSEVFVPVEGWPYQTILTQLAQSPAMNASAF